jgi:hypothetical protein
MESAMAVARPSRRTRGVLAGLVLVLAGVMAPMTTSTVAKAATEVGVINVTWQFSYTYGCIGCGSTVVGSSSGHLSGVDSNGTAYDMFWPGPAGTTGALTNLGVNYGMTMVCRPAPLGGTISGTFTVSGATLVYGGAVYTASVSASFGGTIEGTTVVADVFGATVNGGPSVISITTTQSLGALQMVPTTPVAAACVLGTTQGFAVSGPILTLL